MKENNKIWQRRKWKEKYNWNDNSSNSYSLSCLDTIRRRDELATNDQIYNQREPITTYDGLYPLIQQKLLKNIDMLQPKKQSHKGNLRPLHLWKNRPQKIINIIKKRLYIHTSNVVTKLGFWLPLVAWMDNLEESELKPKTHHLNRGYQQVPWLLLASETCPQQQDLKITTNQSY